MTDEAAETREAVLLARGVCRLFDAMGHACLTEVTVKNGRRADVLTLDAAGRFTVVEIKTSLADFRADAKWGEYLEFCDHYYFAVPPHFPQAVLPETHGLIVADAWDATILRPSAETGMNGARRKAQTLRFAQLAARRLRLLLDPPL
ncbi:MAG: MmcB family DNA repair protein [Proteobacteria bacterium]|nr:MmcB family DNA repair protein [Pseudomonadota bacterium]MDA0951358.1 MmcB family DNA repair protein [Pseudomonadota bacterium]MDA1070091.1 MmcB family DNA repair protein [Pseudomonadota bacterium]